MIAKITINVWNVKCILLLFFLNYNSLTIDDTYMLSFFSAKYQYLQNKKCGIYFKPTNNEFVRSQKNKSLTTTKW